jgi:hypothetical protein
VTDIETCNGHCAGCGHLKLLAPHRDKGWFCNDCWHAERSKETPYYVCRYHVHQPDDEDDDYAGRRFGWKLGQWIGFPCGDVCYLKEEAIARAKALQQQSSWPGYVFIAEPANGWLGGRIAHPGYMAERRAGLLASHPECER